MRRRDRINNDRVHIGILSWHSCWLPYLRLLAWPGSNWLVLKMARSQGKIGYRIGKSTVGSYSLTPRQHESDAIASLEYDIERQVVTCAFHQRGSYNYFDVEPQVFAEWNHAGSRGTYFNLYIRERYEYDRLSS